MKLLLRFLLRIGFRPLEAGKRKLEAKNYIIPLKNSV